MFKSMSDKLLVFSAKLENGVIKLGHGIAWVYAALLVVIVTQVVLRRGFDSGLIVLEELQWHLYAVGILFGIVYAQVKESHVRVDVLQNKFSQKWKYIVDILGTTILLLPFLYIIFYHGVEFVAESYRIGESSLAPAGLPYRWLIKSAIPISSGLLIIVCINKVLREVIVLVKGEYDGNK